MSDFLLDSLRAGLNSTDPASALAKDACTIAENVEFFYSTLGERRLGSLGIDLPAALTGNANLEAITALYRHLPTDDEGAAELWVLAQKLDGSVATLYRRTSGGWSNVAMADAPVFSGLIPIQMQSLHGKLFFCYPSAVDRMHVWDGTRLRRSGLAEPVAPVATQASASASDYATLIVSDLPTGYWRLEEAMGNFLDSSGAGRNMVVTLNGGSGLVYHISGAIASGGFGIQYNVGDHYPGLIDVETATTPAPMWKPSTNTPGSIDFWVTPNVSTFDFIHTLPRKTIVSSSAGAQASVGLYADFNNNTVRAEYLTQAGTSFYNSTPLASGRTYHIALVVDTIGNGTWYVNGVADGTFVGADEMNAQQLLDRADFFSQCIVGALDEIAVYNIALSAAEVLEHYTVGARVSLGSHYYRARFIEKSGDVVIRRSEPSTSVQLIVVGSSQQITITRPALLSEFETHWETEASLDDTTFHVISTLPAATTTFVDTVPESDYASLPLSEAIGTYSLIPSAQLMTVDEDRLLPCGSFTEPSEKSRVRWTPKSADPSPGADERINTTTDPFDDLDGQEGGSLTGISRAVNGYLYAFKLGHIYKGIRTTKLVGSYEFIPLTKARGALPLSVVEAFDQSGRAAVYFQDKEIGAMQLGANGLQACGFDIMTGEWARVNKNATRVCHGVYYPSKLQVHWWVATGTSDYPDMKLVLQTNEQRITPDVGVRRGWATVPSPAQVAKALCACVFATNVDDNTAMNQTLVPFVGGRVSDWSADDSVQRCDTGTTDNGTAYTARLRSRAFFLAGLGNLFGVLSATLLAQAVAGSVLVKLVKDYGLESIPVTVNLTAAALEDVVVRFLDNCSISEVNALELEFTDSVTPVSWRLHQLSLTPTKEDTSA